MTIIYVDDGESRKRQQEALEWIAKGFQYGEPECKTIGHIPPRPEGQHCPACWMYEARKRAEAVLTPEKQAAKLLGRRGGIRSHETGKGHEWTSDEARLAGRKGAANRWGHKKSENKSSGS